ncbi:MAG: CDP-alcohol phosphatidyltransferase family protein [Patescibacteria group bacterium]|nr:CDP-alcohol phosphatidyltransferase family protein [Patescibacteria group bacterium]
MPTLTSRNLMTNETAVLSFHDKILAKIFLPIIPNWIKPNHLTVLRFIMIPPVAYLTWTENWEYMIPMFLIAGFTDVLDGSLARVRKQITLWGTIADPAADKLLIGSVAVLFLSKEVSFLLAFILVFMEVLIVLGAYSRRRRGEYLSANWSGKLKMLLQVFGLSTLLIAQFGYSNILNPLGVGMLVVSLGFAVMSLITYGL